MQKGRRQHHLRRCYPTAAAAGQQRGRAAAVEWPRAATRMAYGARSRQWPGETPSPHPPQSLGALRCVPLSRPCSYMSARSLPNLEHRLACCPRARPPVTASALGHRLARLAHSLAPGARPAPRSRISSTTPLARRHGNGLRRPRVSHRRRRRRPRRRPRPPCPRDGLRRWTPRRGKRTTCTWRAAPRHGSSPRTRER